MIVVDAHQDIAYNTLAFQRDYRTPVYKKRRAEVNLHPVKGPGIATTSLPDSLLGRVAVVFTTLFVQPSSVKYLEDWVDDITYEDARGAHDQALKQMHTYERLYDETEQIRPVHNLADLDAVLATWDKNSPLEKRVQGHVLVMEGADPILEPRQFEEWYEMGVRVVGPAWQQTRYAAGTGAPGPLTSLGFELLEILGDMNILLDLSHMAEQAYFQAVDRYDGPLIASHSNPRRFADGDRNLSDKMIDVLAERDGVVGIVFYNMFLKHGWKRGDPRREVPLAIVFDAIDHICQLTGSAAHVGIGSDMDGGFGKESIPAGMDTIGDLWWFQNGLRDRGYSDPDIEAILGGNMLRKLREALP